MCDAGALARRKDTLLMKGLLCQAMGDTKTKANAVKRGYQGRKESRVFLDTLDS